MSSIADKTSTRASPDGTGDGRAGGAAGSAIATGRRHYDAQASRDALLHAGGALFDERGYEATTVREIGERAGVDAALIARYFGGKEGLYLASLQRQEGRTAIPPDPARALEHMLTQAGPRGSGPVGLAMVSPTLSDAMRDQVREIVDRHLVEPLASELAANGARDAAYSSRATSDQISRVRVGPLPRSGAKQQFLARARGCGLSECQQAKLPRDMIAFLRFCPCGKENQYRAGPCCCFSRRRDDSDTLYSSQGK